MAIALLMLGGGIFYSYDSVYWSMPTMIFSEPGAAASFGLIHSIGHMVGSLALTLSAGSMTGQAACQPHFCSSLFATSWPAGFSLRSGFRHRFCRCEFSG